MRKRSFRAAAEQKTREREQKATALPNEEEEEKKKKTQQTKNRFDPARRSGDRRAKPFISALRRYFEV